MPPPVRDFCRGPLVQDLTHDLIGPDVRLYWNQAVYKKPGKGHLFPWHQDNGYTFCEPQTYLTCWLALSDVAVANGCPWVMPGLHRRGTLLHRETPYGLEIAGLEDGAAEPLPVRAGDMVVFSSLTPHKTGANRSDDVRRALILQYAPDGMVRICSDGRRVPQNDPIRNMVILSDGAAPESNRVSAQMRRRA